MPSLEDVIARVPGLAGYQAQTQLNQQQSLGALQQAGLLQGILAKARDEQAQQQLRGLLSQTNGDPEEAMAMALKTGNVAAAHALAPVIAANQAVQSRKMLLGIPPEKLKDPEFLRRLGASGMPHTAHFTAEAERQQKLQDDAALMEQMKGAQVPVDRQTVQGPAPGPGVDAALLQAMGGRPAGSPPMSITVSPDGTPDPTLAPTARQGGIFDALAKSPIPEIAAEANILKQRLATAPANNPAATAFFQSRQKALADKEIAIQAADRTAANRVDNKAAVSVIPEEHTGLTGKDYLATLPVGTQNKIKAVVDGRIPLTSFSIRNNERDAIVQMATQYDPTFEAGKAPARMAVQRDFTSGTSSRNVTALNTAISHLGTMSKLGDQLANGDIQAVNQLANAMNVQLGKEAQTNFGLAQTAVGDEMMRVFRQVGASEREAEDWRQRFNRANSPAQMKGALRTAAELLKGRIDALNDTWDRGMDTTGGYPKLLSDRSKAAMASFGVDTSAPATPVPATAKQRIRFDAQGNVIP